MLNEYELRSRCNAAGQTCKTEMGCSCSNPTDWTPPTDFTELEDHNSPNDGLCMVCALSWLVIGLAVGSFVMFIGNLLVDLARRNVS